MIRFTKEEVADAMARLGNTRDGAVLRQSLTDTLLDVLPLNADACALQADAGRRNFAMTLLKALNAGIETNVSGAEHVRHSEPAGERTRRRGTERRVPG